jgi:PBP1b-binding outer membrane lipoprotein LpoB
MMKRYLFIAIFALLFSGCISTPYASIGASKTVNVGGVDVGVGIGNILRP